MQFQTNTKPVPVKQVSEEIQAEIRIGRVGQRETAYREAREIPSWPRKNLNARSRTCNVGTIGHVDHGKTTLTAAITKQFWRSTGGAEPSV